MKKIIGLVHYLAILLLFTTPFWAKWYWIIVGAIAYYLVVNRWLGYCPLTKWQYGDTSEGFIEKNFNALFKVLNYHPNKKKLKRFITYGIPITIISFAIIWQNFLSQEI